MGNAGHCTCGCGCLHGLRRADLLPCVALEIGESKDLGLPRLQKCHIVLQMVDLLLQQYEATDQIVCQSGIRLIRRALKVGLSLDISFKC